MAVSDEIWFSENDIRPTQLNFDKEAAYARDVERLLCHRETFVTVPCPACRSTNARLKWEKWTLRYLECLGCGTVYVSPRPNEEALADYYQKSEVYAYWREKIFPASEAVRREKIVKPRVTRIVDLCTRYNVPAGRLIEVGPGFGTFCEEVLTSRTFRDVVAIEPTPPLAEACRARGIRVIEESIERAQIEELSADIVVAFEVIEHLFHPKAFLEACLRALRPGGLIIVTCPNVAGFELITLGAVADTVDTEHLNYFNPSALSLLMRDVGIEVLEAQTPGVLDAEIVRNKVLTGKYSLDGQRFLETVLIDKWIELGESFQAFLRSGQLSSHMWIAGRRRIETQP